MVMLVLSACGGGDDLSADKIEDALKASFSGNLDPLKEITCDAEQASMENTTAVLPEGSTVELDCKIDGDEVSCTGIMSMAVEGTDERIETGMGDPLKMTIKDGKLCGVIQ